MIGVTTPPNFHRRHDEHRVPVYRSPALHYDMLPENLALDGSNRSALISDRSGNSAVNCLVLNATIGNYGSTPSAAPIKITGPIDIRADLAPVTWSSLVGVLGKDNNATARSYSVFTTANGSLLFLYSPDGTATRSVTSSVPTGFSAFARAQVRYTYDSATGKVNFYTRTDGDISSHTGWTALGAEQSLTAGTIFDSTTALTVGSFTSGGAPINGNLFRAQIYNGIAGTLAFDFDPSVAAKLAGTVTERSANAATVTINSTGDLGARIAGARDACQFTLGKEAVYTAPAGGSKGFITEDGSNDYQKAPAFPQAQPAVVLFAGSYVSFTNLDCFFDGNADDSMAFYQRLDPALSMYSGNVLGDITPGANTRFIGTTLFNGVTNSAIRQNRISATTGNAGTIAGNGFTLAARGGGASRFGNITASELLIYQGAQYDSVARDRLARQMARYHRIAA